ncbi:UNVERIFIED_CONTAM: Wall-associated receptor kinase-like 8 [Sesamum latifolium]|uniref:Wall-associated receptor kinase-like 8 n=1 Tax=Sesamum latifolium TaxID=2727402 RepID=A0AAW2YCH1_9LAMI
MEEDHLFDILDPSILKEGRREEVVAIAELARRCLHSNGKKRPRMMEVAVELEGIQLLKEGKHAFGHHYCMLSQTTSNVSRLMSGEEDCISLVYIHCIAGI